jgi:UDP-glucose 4-epimerase
MMSLPESIDLVEFAFSNAKPGDIFVQKAPASTIEDIALAIKDIFNASNEIKIIGTRHGEKLYESLCNREEMAKAIDLEHFYRIPADNRDLNYGKYFENGDVKASALDDYNSHNTIRLTFEQVKEKILSLDYIKGQLA